MRGRAFVGLRWLSVAAQYCKQSYNGQTHGEFAGDAIDLWCGHGEASSEIPRHSLGGRRVLCIVKSNGVVVKQETSDAKQKGNSSHDHYSFDIPPYKPHPQTSKVGYPTALIQRQKKSEVPRPQAGKPAQAGKLHCATRQLRPPTGVNTGEVEEKAPFTSRRRGS